MTCIQGYSLRVHGYEALARLFPNVGSFVRALLDHLQFRSVSTMNEPAGFARQIAPGRPRRAS